MQRSSGVNQGSNCSGMPYGYQIWWEEPLTGVMHWWGQRCISRGQPEVLRNALRPPNLVGRTFDQNVMHWGQVMQGSAGVNHEVKLLRNALRPPNLVGRTPRGWPGERNAKCALLGGQRSCRGQLGRTPLECDALVGSKVMQGSAGVNQRSNCLEML